MLNRKKGILGLDKVKAVMLALLVLAVIFVTIILATVNLRDVAEDFDRISETVTNTNTTQVINDSVAIYLCGTDGGQNYRGCSVSVDNFTNATGTEGFVINSANYTIVNCSVILIENTGETDATNYNNTGWNFTGTCTWSNAEYQNVNLNLSSGGSGFFKNSSTFISILVVVVIISLIAIVIAVVSGFGGGGGLGGSNENLRSPKTGGGGFSFGGGNIKGGRKSFGSNTLSGI